ncbi:MAG: hypothetical protein WDZ90_00515 [Candidatus Paceibacterota bacterium]
MNKMASSRSSDRKQLERVLSFFERGNNPHKVAEIEDIGVARAESLFRHWLRKREGCWEPLDGEGVVFEELRAETCRWPLWGDELPPPKERLYCGAEKNDYTSPYCPRHMVVAHMPPRS